MPIAVPKSEGIEFVRYHGPKNDVYPDWFIELINDGQIYEQYGTMIWADEHGELAMSDGDVILRNKRGRVRIMDPWTFNSIFYEVD